MLTILLGRSKRSLTIIIGSLEARKPPVAIISRPSQDRQHVTMSDKAQELYDATFAVLPYLKASTDPYVQEIIDELVKDRDLSAGDRLRREAEAADRRDAAILRLREALTEFAASRAC